MVAPQLQAGPDQGDLSLVVEELTRDLEEKHLPQEGLAPVQEDMQLMMGLVEGY